MKENSKIIAINRKAFHDYEIIQKYEAGIELHGSEVKSIREGKINLKDSYAILKKKSNIYNWNAHWSIFAYRFFGT